MEVVFWGQPRPHSKEQAIVSPKLFLDLCMSTTPAMAKNLCKNADADMFAVANLVG